MSARRAPLFAAAIALAPITSLGAARADERISPYDAPAPPTLPALAHPKLTYTFEITGASIASSNKGGARSVMWSAHSDVELPIVPRRWYVGFAHDVAGGAVPGVGNNLFVGNPELYGRGLWTSAVGLAAGGGLGVVIPSPRTLTEDEVTVLHAVRVVRPWDQAYYSDLSLTLRPFIDVRHIVWRFVFQLRQGLDVSFVVRPLRDGEHRYDIVSRTTVYVGFRASKEIGLGLEVWEVYAITADVPDDKRASFVLSPSVRFMLGRITPAISVVVPVTTPLLGEASSYFGVRLNAGIDFDAVAIPDP